MSQGNVEVVRRAIEGLNARSIETIEQVAAPDLEWRPILTAGGDLERRVYRGPAGIEQYLADLAELFEGTQIRVEVLDAIGPDQILFGGHATARGRESGVQLEEPIWALWELRDRKLVRGTGFRSRLEVLEAVGLRK